MKKTLTKAEKLAKTHTKAIESLMKALDEEGASTTIMTDYGAVTFEPARVRAQRRRALKAPTEESSEADKAVWKQAEQLDEIDALEGEFTGLQVRLGMAVDAQDEAKVLEVRGKMEDLARRLRDLVVMKSEANTH